MQMENGNTATYSVTSRGQVLAMLALTVYDDSVGIGNMTGRAP